MSAAIRTNLWILVLVKTCNIYLNSFFLSQNDRICLEILDRVCRYLLEIFKPHLTLINELGLMKATGEVDRKLKF